MSSSWRQSAAARSARDESTDETPPVWTRENLFRGLDESLARMRIDYVDVMQLHKPQRRALSPPVLDNPVTTVLNGTGSRQRLGC
ncbi:MAG TPA: hypothetical protein VI030_15455 [Propionibacteriaceae bacterium]